MTWKDYLKDKERAEIEQAEALRDSTRKIYNAMRERLKGRADARKRRAVERARQGGRGDD